MLTQDELQTALRAGYEARGFELKGPGLRTDKAFLVKVVRAALGMGNLRDGGYVVIGIADEDPTAMLPGLGSDELATWLDYDRVSDQFALYADPPLRFDLTHVSLSSGADVVLLQVHEFDDTPHLCAREYQDSLRKGAMYVRSRRKPETAEVASSVEMREVLDLAAEKRLRAYVETAQRARVRLSVDDGGAGSAADEQAREAFMAQRREGIGE